MHKISLYVMFTLMTEKKGIKIHGKRTTESMYKEYTQLEDMKVMRSLEPGILTKSQKIGSLRAINLIKEKLWKTKSKDVHIW